MPAVYGQLAGNDRGAPAGAIVEQLEQIMAFGRPARGKRPVVQDQHVGACKRREPAPEAAVAVSDAQLLGMFIFLFDFHGQTTPDFQGLVTQHANLPDVRFQAALIELL